MKSKNLFLHIAQLLIEFFRWVVIALFLVLIFRLAKEIIDPLFTDEVMRQTVYQILNLSLFGGIITGIKKLQSLPVLFMLSLFLFILIILDKHIIRGVQKIIGFFQIYGEKRI